MRDPPPSTGGNSGVGVAMFAVVKGGEWLDVKREFGADKSGDACDRKNNGDVASIRLTFPPAWRNS